MKARFQGGALDGREFTIGEPPPRGLDVEHEARIHRYAFEALGEFGEAVYIFVSKRWWRGDAGGPMIHLGGELRAAPLAYYARTPKSDDSTLGF
jgi:hypothetical protein